MTFNELRNKLFKNYELGAISDEQLVQIIEQAKDYLNLKTITNTATIRCKSYNGIKQFSYPDIVIDGVKFYVNNE
jgi:hypothetical protein